jgi:hypothetical protein
VVVVVLVDVVDVDVLVVDVVEVLEVVWSAVVVVAGCVEVTTMEVGRGSVVSRPSD